MFQLLNQFCKLRAEFIHKSVRIWTVGNQGLQHQLFIGIDIRLDPLRVLLQHIYDCMCQQSIVFFQLFDKAVRFCQRHDPLNLLCVIDNLLIGNIVLTCLIELQGPVCLQIFILLRTAEEPVQIHHLV